MKRRLLRIVGFSLALVGCTSEAGLVAPRQIPLRTDQSAAPSRTHTGSISATVTFFKSDSWITYRTRDIPVQAKVESGRLKMDEHATESMLSSFYVAGQGKRLVNASLPGSQASVPLQLAAYSGSGPEQDLVNWANANQINPGPEDDFLQQPPWATLTGAYYAEDVSAAHDGSAWMQVYVDPISSANPNGQVRMYLNGHIMASVNPQYEYWASDGGYALRAENGVTYRYSGATSGTGSRNLTLQEPTRQQQTTPLPHPWLRFAAATCQPLKAAGEHLLNSVLPAIAYAQGVGCNYYMREMAIGVGGMVVSGIMGNPLGFALSMIGVANRLHAYARCKENEKKTT